MSSLHQNKWTLYRHSLSKKWQNPSPSTPFSNQFLAKKNNNPFCSNPRCAVRCLTTVPPSVPRFSGLPLTDGIRWQLWPPFESRRKLFGPRPPWSEDLQPETSWWFFPTHLKTMPKSVKLDHVSPIFGLKIPANLWVATTNRRCFYFFVTKKNPSKHNSNMSEPIFGGDMFWKFPSFARIWNSDVGGKICWHEYSC